METKENYTKDEMLKIKRKAIYTGMLASSSFILAIGSLVWVFFKK